MRKTDEQGGKVITIRGLVTPADWNDEGKATRVAIATFDEDEFFVDDEQVGLQLLGFLGKAAVVRGILQETGRKKFLRQCAILKVKETPFQSSIDGAGDVGRERG
jgi:hypothetical protein